MARKPSKRPNPSFPTEDEIPFLRAPEPPPAKSATEPPALGGIAQVVEPPARNAFGRYCRVTVEIEQDDEDGVRTSIKTSPWSMDGPKQAIRFIRRHTGYDPFA